MIGGIKGATLAGTAARTAGAGALTDFLAFQGDAGRLADLLPSVPIVEYLQSKEGDSEIEGRLKNSIEGLGLGIAAHCQFNGFKTLRRNNACYRNIPKLWKLSRIRIRR